MIWSSNTFFPYKIMYSGWVPRLALSRFPGYPAIAKVTHCMAKIVHTCSENLYLKNTILAIKQTKSH